MQPRRRSQLIFAAAIISILFVSYLLDNDKNNPPVTQKTEQQKVIDKGPPCAYDYKQCHDNEAIVNIYNGMLKAKSACSIEVEEKVSFGKPKWWWVKFGMFVKGESYKETGIATIADDRVKLQNQYGTYEKSLVSCEYDLDRKTVLSVTINGREFIISAR